MVLYFFDGIKSLLEKADEIKLGDCLFVINEEECGFFVCKGRVHSEALEESLACYEIVKAIANNKKSCILCSLDLVKGRSGDILQIKYLADLFKLEEIQSLLDNAIRILSFSVDLWEMNVCLDLWKLVPINESKRFWLSASKTEEICFTSDVAYEKFSPVTFLPRTKEQNIETGYEIFTADSILGGRKYINGYTLERVDDGIKVIGTLGCKVFDIVYYYGIRNEIVGYRRDLGYMLIKSFGMSSFCKEMSLEVYHDVFRIVKDNNDNLGLLNRQIQYLKGKNDWSDMSYLGLGILLVTTSKSKELISIDTYPEKILSMVDMVSCEQFHKEVFLCTLRNGNQKLVNVRTHQQTNYDFLSHFERITENLICAKSKEQIWYIFRYDNISEYLYKSSSFPELNDESGELRMTLDKEFVYINLYGERISGVATNNTEKLISAVEKIKSIKKAQELEERLDIDVIALVNSNHIEKKVDVDGCQYFVLRKGTCNFQKNDRILWIVLNDSYVYYTTYSKVKTKYCFFVESKYSIRVDLDYSHMQYYFPLMFEVKQNLDIKFEIGKLLRNLWDSRRLNNPKIRKFYSFEEINAILTSEVLKKEEPLPLVENVNIDSNKEPIVESKTDLWQNDLFLKEIMIAYKKLCEIGFDEEHIYEALLMLYPMIEEKELQPHFGATLLGLRNELLELLGIPVAESDKNVLDKLDCDAIQLGTINYYRNIKGYTLELAIKCTIQDQARNLAYVASAKELEEKYKMISNRKQLIVNKRIQLIQEIVSYGLEREEQLGVIKGEDDSNDNNPVEFDFEEINNEVEKSRELVSKMKTLNRNGICMLNSNEIPILEFDKIYSQSLFHKKKMANYFVNNYYDKWNCVLIFVPKKRTADFDRQGTGIYEIIGEGNDKRLPQDFGTNANGKIRNQKINGKRILIFSSLNSEYCEFYDEVDYVDYLMIEDEDSVSKRKIINFRLKSKIRFI